VPQPPLLALQELEQYDGRIPLDVLHAWITRTTVTIDDVRAYMVFSTDHYVRNLLHAGPSYQALVLCWHSGQRSPLHDHRGSSCAVKIISGVATETLFDKAANGMVYATASRQLAAGDSCASQDADIHQMSNLQPEGHDLVTLHIYSPPLFRMNMYSLVDAKVKQFFDPVNEEFLSGAGI
jgi:cysteine dioxygenase